jgi:transcriptional regulator with GAF, ATPase, and Fis domain
MKATTTWEQHEETDLPDDTSVDASLDACVELNVHANGNGNVHDEHPKADLYSKATALKRLVHSLLIEVQSLDNIPTVDFKEGIDFYEEVRRFEIALIQHALAQTGGHQMRAARLLKMKVTTLNSKIKHYDIRLDVLVGGLYLPNAGGNNGTRDQA